MNVCRSVGHVSSCPCTQAQHNIRWLRPFYNSPTCPTLPRPVGKTLWKMCCLAGANDNDNKHASSPEVRNFLTWQQRSIAKYTTLHRTTPPPTPFTLHDWHAPVPEVGAYFHIIHSFAHPSILKMWILAHHHCLITRALYPSCTDVCMYVCM